MVTVQASFGCCCRRRYAGFRIVPVTAKSQATESTAGGLARVPPTRCLKPWAHLGADSRALGQAPSVRGIRPLPRRPRASRAAVASLGVPSKRAHRTQQRVPSQNGDARIDISVVVAAAALAHRRASGSATSIRPKLARSREGPKPTLDGPCPSAQAVPSARGSNPAVEPARLGWAGRASPSRRAGGDSHLAVHLLACVRVLRHTRGATPRCKRAARCCSESTLCLGSR